MEHKNICSVISEKTGMDTRTVARLLEEFASIIGGECAELNRVAIPGFGSFEGVKHEEEIRTDLSTGRKKLYPPMIEVVFSAGTMLKKRFN